MSNEINVTSLVALLSARDGAALEMLRRRHPGVAALQPGLKVLGAQSEASLAAFQDLAAETLRVSRDRMGEIARHLDRRLRWARRIRLGSSLVGGVASAGLLGAVLLEQRLAALISACITFAGSTFAIVADFIENGGTGNSGGLAALRLRAASAIGRIATLDGEIRLLALREAPAAERIAVIQQANALAADIRQIEFDAGLFVPAEQGASTNSRQLATQSS